MTVYCLLLQLLNQKIRKFPGETCWFQKAAQRGSGPVIRTEHSPSEGRWLLDYDCQFRQLSASAIQVRLKCASHILKEHCRNLRRESNTVWLTFSRFHHSFSSYIAYTMNEMLTSINPYYSAGYHCFATILGFWNFQQLYPYGKKIYTYDRTSAHQARRRFPRVRLWIWPSIRKFVINYGVVRTDKHNDDNYYLIKLESKYCNLSVKRGIVCGTSIKLNPLW